MIGLNKRKAKPINTLILKLDMAPLTLKIGLLILIIHIVIAITGPFWAPYSYSQIGVGIPASGMSYQHPMGIDQLGRDVFSRVIHGAHIVLLLAVLGTSLGMVVGTILGFLSAYLGGYIDEIFQRANEVLISIPFLVFGLVAINIAGPKLAGKPILIIIVVGIVSESEGDREILAEEGIRIALSNNTDGFIECSPRTGENVEEAFEALTRLMLQTSQN